MDEDVEKRNDFCEGVVQIVGDRAVGGSIETDLLEQSFVPVGAGADWAAGFRPSLSDHRAKGLGDGMLLLLGRALSPLFWTHINPYGTFDLDMNPPRPRTPANGLAIGEGR